MKTLTPTFEATQDKTNIKRFKDVTIRRRYWDGGTKTYKLEASDFDLNPYLLKVGTIKWKLDTEALNEYKTSNVTVTFKNTNNYFDEENASGIWNDGGTFLSNRSEVRIKIGVITPGDVKETIRVFTGYIDEPPIVKPGAPEAQIRIMGKEIVLEDVDATNFSKRPVEPPVDYRYENVDIFGANTIGDTGFAFVPNEHQFKMIRIYSGLGRGQERYILSHTATTFTIFPNWVTVPDGTSDFEIFGEDLGVGNGILADFDTVNVGVGKVVDVWVDSVKMKQGVDYQVSQLNDRTLQAKVTFEAGSIPGVGERVTVEYYYWYQNIDPHFIVEELVKLAGFTSSEYQIDPVIMPNNVRVEWLQDTKADFDAGWIFQDISTAIQAGFLRIDDIPIAEWKTYWERHAEYVAAGIVGDLHWSRDVNWGIELQINDEEGHWWGETYNDDQTRLRNEHCGFRYGLDHYTADSRWITFTVKDTDFLEPRWTFLEFNFIVGHPVDPTTIPAMSVETNVSTTGAYGGEEEGWVAATVQAGEHPYKWDINSAEQRYMKVRIKFTGADAEAFVNQNYIIDSFRAYFYPWGKTHSSIRDCSAVLVVFGKLYVTDDDGVPTPIPNRFQKYYTRFTPTPFFDEDQAAPIDIFGAATIGDTGLAMVVDEHTGRVVEIVAGLGVGQFREVASNTATTLTVSVAWGIVPNGTSAFKVHQWSPWELVPPNQQIVHSPGYWVSGTTQFLQTKTELQSDTVITGSGGAYPRVDDILVDYYTSTFVITMANMTGLTAWTAIKQLAKMVDYEIGVTADGKFFFRQKRNTISSADMEVTEDARLFKVGDKRKDWNRVKNVIKVSYGDYEKVISPETELEDPPHSITKYGERIFEVSGGNLLAPPDHDLTQGLAMNYYGIYDNQQVLISHKYPDPRDAVRITMKFLPRLDLSDAILIRKTAPGSSGNEFIDDQIFVILGITLDVEKWIMHVDALQPYGN